MNNEAIAVKCSLHGPQIVRQRQSSIYTLIHSNYCRPRKRSGRKAWFTIRRTAKRRGAARRDAPQRAARRVRVHNVCLERQ